MSETETIQLESESFGQDEVSDLTQGNRFPLLAAHRAEWLESLKAGYRHRSFLIRTSHQGTTLGELPLMLVSGPIFGKFLCSLPYINTGGAWATNDRVAHALVDQACTLADQTDAKYLELRHEVPLQHPLLNFERTDKVHMRLELPASDAELDKSFKSKLRSQVRKSGTHNHEIRWGGRELLAAFYSVFATNMRDLGTPVFSVRLFESILDVFQSDAEICVLENGGQPVAGALLVHGIKTTEIPSASTLRSWNHTGANMWMYRHLLQRAIERGSETFDFGRSSVGSGTYKFKAQWGAKPHPAVWQYYVRKGSVEDMRPDSAKNQRLIKTWQKLPVWLTRLIGPSIVRGIP
ncbi:MAG: FemAB family PEP-CTERM system-associated protein [Rubripirellula sp.]|nr:FemAB family PEP-CTERM system-associated protein [Rubripirellula sp.]